MYIGVYAGPWPKRCQSGLVHPQQILPSFHRMVDLSQMVDVNSYPVGLSTLWKWKMQIIPQAVPCQCHLMPFMSARRLHLELFVQYRRSLSGQSGQ